HPRRRRSMGIRTTDLAKSSCDLILIALSSFIIAGPTRAQAQLLWTAHLDRDTGKIEILVDSFALPENAVIPGVDAKVRLLRQDGSLLGDVVYKVTDAKVPFLAARQVYQRLYSHGYGTSLESVRPLALVSPYPARLLGSKADDSSESRAPTVTPDVDPRCDKYSRAAIRANEKNLSRAC